MCLIAASPRGKPLTDAAIIEAWGNNPHGFGVMYATENRIVTKKTRKLKTVFKLLAEAEGKPFVAHFRWATHGVKNIDNTHPFEITENLSVAHNGIIKIDCPVKDKSDTWHYVQKLKTLPDVLSEPQLKMIGEEIGKGNKLAFLHSAGDIKIVNEGQGDWEGDIWYSNAYSVADSVFYQWKWSPVPKTDAPYCGEVNGDSEAWDYCELCGQSDWLTWHFDVEMCKTCTNLYGDEIEADYWKGLDDKQDPQELDVDRAGHLKHWSN
jgi:hypothetical protein